MFNIAFGIPVVVASNYEMIGDVFSYCIVINNNFFNVSKSKKKEIKNKKLPKKWLDDDDHGICIKSTVRAKMRILSRFTSME